MTSMKEYRLGYGSAVAVTVEVAVFAAELIWYLISPSPAADAVSYIACMLLAPTYVTMIACTPAVTGEGSGSFTRAALALAAMYGVLCAGVYYLQLSVLRLGTYPASPDALVMLRFTPGSPAFALDMLGYTFMCLSTLVLVPAIPGKGSERVLKIFCAINGFLAVPTLIFPALRFAQAGTGASGSFGSIVLLFWCVVFIPIPIVYARLFKERGELAASAVS
ncbi:MAG: hypothetical protein ABSG63_00205 [Spirochaetia bacterium]|jgi:hypothetical protein